MTLHFCASPHLVNYSVYCDFTCHDSVRQGPLLQAQASTVDPVAFPGTWWPPAGHWDPIGTPRAALAFSSGPGMGESVCQMALGHHYAYLATDGSCQLPRSRVRRWRVLSLLRQVQFSFAKIVRSWVGCYPSAEQPHWTRLPRNHIGNKNHKNSSWDGGALRALLGAGLM